MMLLLLLLLLLLMMMMLFVAANQGLVEEDKKTLGGNFISNFFLADNSRLEFQPCLTWEIGNKEQVLYIDAAMYWYKQKKIDFSCVLKQIPFLVMYSFCLHL